MTAVDIETKQDKLPALFSEPFKTARLWKHDLQNKETRTEIASKKVGCSNTLNLDKMLG
jgi:hypothetical protein